MQRIQRDGNDGGPCQHVDEGQDDPQPPDQQNEEQSESQGDFYDAPKLLGGCVGLGIGFHHRSPVVLVVVGSFRRRYFNIPRVQYDA